MAGDRVRGLAESLALFDRVTPDARDQLGVELAIISREILAAQQAAVPVDSGQLRAGLAIALSVEQLRTRIGILGRRNIRGRNRSGKARSARKRNYDDLFYGRIVEYGRTAQTVIVTRTARRLTGGSRKLANKAAIAAKAYRMKVTALAARPFINIPGAEDLALGQLAEFWSRVLARSGAA